MGRDYYFIQDTTISFRNETERGPYKDWLHHKFRHYGYFYRIMNMLAAEGFIVRQDPDVSKIIRNDYWIGKRRDLEFDAQKYNNGFKVEFFQNVVHENQSGGRYDFHKLEKMPYLIRLQYQKYMDRIVGLLESLADVENSTTPIMKSAEDQIKVDLVYNWRMYKSMDFNLHDLDGEVPERAGYHARDKNGKEIRNGDVKYFRNHWNGYLMRGRVYYRANMHWWAVVNDREIILAENGDLFDDFPSGEPARIAPDRTPKEYKKHREELEGAKTKELIAELRRRGFKVPTKYKGKGASEKCCTLI